MPRSRAALYFEIETNFPHRPDPKAFFPTAPPDAAERAAYGASSPDDVVRACRLFGAASWLRVFDRAFHGKHAAGPGTYFKRTAPASRNVL